MRHRAVTKQMISNNTIHFCTAVVAQKLLRNWYSYKCINNLENNVKTCLLNVFYKSNIYYLNRYLAVVILLNHIL